MGTTLCATQVGGFCGGIFSRTLISSNLKGGGSVFLLFSHTVYEITADSLSQIPLSEKVLFSYGNASFLKNFSDSCCCHRNMKNLQEQGLFFWQWFCFASHMVSLPWLFIVFIHQIKTNSSYL